MSDLSERIAALSPEKREVLLRRLQEQKRRQDQPKEPSQAPIRPRNKAIQTIPLSFAQEQLWFLDQLAPGNPTYIIPEALRVKGPLNLAALEDSLNEIVRRQENLRTSFALVNGHPVQVITPTLRLTLSVTDLGALEPAKREAEAARLAHEEARQPFDLMRSPLIRACLIRLDASDHLLVITTHHIISDAWSMDLLIRELTTFYAALATGQPIAPPEQSLQFADIVLWEREQLTGDVLEKHLAYWKHYMAGAPATLELPTDFARPSVQSFRGARLPFTIPDRLSARLQALAEQEKTTLFITLLTAFQTLLSRYNGEEDIVIGSPVATRHQAATHGVMGFLVNMLVLRGDLSGNPSFRQLLRRMHKLALGAYAHQDFPFEKLVEALQPERSLSHTPIFQVAFAMQNPARPAIEVAGVTLHPVELESGTAKFDLMLYLWETPRGLAGAIEYNTDLFEASTIARMRGNFETLLTGMVADPGQLLSELPLLTDAERQQLLVEWNQTDAEYPKDQCVHQLFEAQAAQTPEAVALVYRDVQLTYRALNHRANQLTCRLQQLGVGPGVHVGLCLDRSIELIVGMLGILKAGGAYVPLDPASPRERLAFMVQDSQARVLVAREGLGEALQGLGLPVVSLDPEWQALAKEPAEYENNGVHSGHPAYVMYTSGSTGTPKGVEIQHRSIARLLFGGAYARLGRDETILHLAATSFDAATFEVWGALLHGARCVLFPERLPTPKSIGAALQKYGVTTLWLTASLFNAVIDEAPEGLKGVRQLLTGGEALSVTHIRRALELLPTTQLINGYGPTESTTFTCCYPIPKNLPRNTRSIPIGRPIGNTQVYVLDRSLHPVPIGVPGELHIGGAGLARGYLNRPELTAEKFIAHPFGPEPGAVLYKTGDLVRYLPDGTLEFLGRRDQQIKLRGFRVELGEIETVLGLHPAVKEALVQVYESGYHEKRLIAYVVLGQEQPVADQELRDFLSRRLPDYMLPATFLVLDALPITPNGKIDRRALPLPASTHRPAEAAVVPPTHIAHFQLLQIWEELLEARPIGMTDNFFHLGGHSLLAARLVDRIEQVFQKKITLASLFAGPTIEHLAVALEQQPTRQQTRTPLVAVQAGGARRPFFFAHGDWNSGAFYCFPLARALGPEQPFYVLEPYKFDGLRVPPTFEEVATAHLQAIRALQPEGPYLLGGFCNGGLVAYEMARQLEAAGQKVALLLLIDPATPAPRSQQFIHHLLNHLGALTHLGPDKTLNLFLRLRYGYISLRHYYRYLRIPHYRNKIDHERSIDTKGQFQPKKKKPFLPGVKLLRQEWGAMYRWVISAYAPGPYAGKITIFWPREELFHQTGWAGVARGAKEEVHIIPGTHDTCRTDYLTILAEHLKACLLQAQEA